MQTHGYLMINNQKVLILVQNKKYSQALKLRLTGMDGNFFEDESCFMSQNQELFEKLLSGEVVNI